MSELNLVSDAAYEQAEREGLKVVLPAENELFVDIDSQEAFEEFERRYYTFSDYGMVNGFTKTPSKSGIEGRYHVVVKLYAPVTPTVRVLLQAVLGSDWKREMFSYIRIFNGDQKPTLFFEKP